MATGVKGRRAHEGKGGQARTRLARRAVIQAARVLFLERGYAATTIEAISEESDVPPATVYRLFSSKLGILKALLDVSIAGDDEAVPLQNRPHARALFDDPDPRNQLSGFAGITAGIMSRAEPVTGSSSARPARIPTQPLCWPSRRGNATRAKNRSHVPWPGPARYGRACASATPPTSSTRSCPPRSTGCSSVTEAGRPNGTSNG